ncbi:MAG TPA: DNA polymerase III subunit delta' [Acidocella sp.]|jgi:DNA polymerase-3 subunit delta'|uniref:DNA polymerase III subunit delta' n=1 Tax=Acidocella sp. TaxID=50710 RepID=UPI002C9B052B|nr:DNA polymerase III subunit delta' [Acidocella sp.]HVE21143.1 DNA polymerase III subunit delta' [Acidocella sp.]
MLDPRANPHFRGHESAVAALHHAAMSGRLHHGWLISGQPGIGKATLAFRFARWLLAGESSADLSVPETAPVFRRVAAGTHPDLFTVERRVNVKTERLQSEIVIATVQEASAFMRLTPAEGGWRVVVIDGAEDMNPNAANALLKVLEEPPARAILLLVSSAPGRLLPTIRSRCRALPLAPLPETDMAALLAAYAPDLGGEEHARLVRLAEGSIGTALSLAEDGIAVAGLVDEVLAAPVSPARAQAIADNVARAVEGVDKFDTFMTLLRAGLAAHTRAAARAGQPAAQLAGRVALWQEFAKLEHEVLGLNLDKRAAVIVALSQLHRT